MFKYSTTPVKYECQKSGGNLKYILQSMINDKVVQEAFKE